MKLTALAISIGCLVGWFSGFCLNVTTSLPVGLYRKVYGPLRYDDVVFFCLESRQFVTLAQERGYVGPGTCPGGLRPLGKQIHGLPGDVLNIDAAGAVSINGLAIPGSAPRTRDSAGRAMPAPELAPGVIPTGQALVLALADPGSFDGRYFGLVRIEGLTPVRPVLTYPIRRKP